jgi:hypothetical protein
MRQRLARKLRKLARLIEGKKRTPPASSDLQDMSEHVSYEIDMLVETATKLLDLPKADQVTHNALVESFLIHMRQLVHFFYVDPDLDTDIAATDYLAAWPGKRPLRTETLKRLAGATSKKAVHLTVDRLTKMDYEVREAGHDLLKAVRQFLGAKPLDYTYLPKSNLSPGWDDPTKLFSYSSVAVTRTDAPQSTPVLQVAAGPLPPSPVSAGSASPASAPAASISAKGGKGQKP